MSDEKALRIIEMTFTGPNHTAIGQLARDLRTRANLSLDDVASKMRITRAYLSVLEQGKRSWTPKLVERFNKALSNL